MLFSLLSIPLVFFQFYNLPDKGFCAHRGAMETHPENTLAAFKEAVDLGAHMIELDVQLSRDGAMVIMHDETVDRTTNGTGKVSEMDLDEIRVLDAGSWKSLEFAGEQVPVLEEVLEIMPRNIWLNIHIKGGAESGRKVASLIDKTDRKHQAVLAVMEDARKGAQEVNPELLVCNMERQSGNLDYVESTILMEAGFIQLRGEIFPGLKEYTQRLHQQGVRVNFFGTDDREEIEKLFEYGIDFPLVNDIGKALQIGEELGIKRIDPKF